LLDTWLRTASPVAGGGASDGTYTTTPWQRDGAAVAQQDLHVQRSLTDAATTALRFTRAEAHRTTVARPQPAGGAPSAVEVRLDSGSVGDAWHAAGGRMPFTLPGAC
jgi:hypothetical protein